MESQGNPPPFNPNPWGWDHPPPPPPPPPPNFGWQGPGFAAVDGFHHPNNFHHNNGRPDFHYDGDFHGGADQPLHSFNAPPDDFSGAGGGSRQPYFPRKRKLDCADGGNYAKLYVAGITRTVAEDEIRHVFEEHGNVLEVVLLNDKRTGQHQEYCFVKYESTEEAGRAIKALHNQFTFPGAMAPVKVRYASGERERLGLMQHDRSLSRSGFVQHDSHFSGADEEAMHKVYVNGVNKEASHQEILEVFSSYGDVADVYIMRDKLKQSRGCCFVGFTHRYMAVAAINGLNGTYVMKGCDRPLIIRFADPKKPKNGELRQAPNSVDLRRNNLPNITHLGISSASTPETSTNVQAGIFAPLANHVQCPSEMQQAPCQQPFSPSRFSQMSLQQSQSLQVSSQSSIQVDSQRQTPLHLNRTSNGNVEQQHDSQPPCLFRDVQPHVAMQSSEPAPSTLSASDLPEGPIDCDWSEHICPDGHKYYYNCATCESRWEMPEEFALYERQIQSERLQNHPSQEPYPCSASEAPTEEVSEAQEAPQMQSDDIEEPQLPASCAVEHTHEQVQVESSPLGKQAFVK